MKSQAELMQDLWEKINTVRVGMLSTIEDDGTIRSRPMYTQEKEHEQFDGTLWFFTNDASHKVEEIQKEREVNVSYAEPKNGLYISVSGVASLVDDRALIEEMWNPTLKAWFPDGLEDPHIALLSVRVNYAEVWDDSGSRIVHLFGMLKSIAKGERYQPGENEKINV